MKHPAGEIPPGAGQLFPADRLPLVQGYADRLATDGIERGLIGPREIPRLWNRHLLNCALMAPLLPVDATVADIGSGAGLPGIVLALARPDVQVTLVESLLRRTSFLEEVVAELGLDNVVVIRGRAEELHEGPRYEVVTARAVAPLERLLGWCMPLVAPTGALIALKGASVAEEIAAAASTLRRLGCAAPVSEVLHVEGSPIESTTVVRVTWADPERVTYRSSGGSSGRRRSGRRNTRRR